MRTVHGAWSRQIEPGRGQAPADRARSLREFAGIWEYWRAVTGMMKGGFDCRMGIGLPNLYSEVPFTSFRGKTARIAFPDDPRMFQHIHPVGMRKCESNVLLAEQHRNRRCLA